MNRELAKKTAELIRTRVLEAPEGEELDVGFEMDTFYMDFRTRLAGSKMIRGHVCKTAGCLAAWTLLANGVTQEDIDRLSRRRFGVASKAAEALELDMHGTEEAELFRAFGDPIEVMNSEAKSICLQDVPPTLGVAVMEVAAETGKVDWQKAYDRIGHDLGEEKADE